MDFSPEEVRTILTRALSRGGEFSEVYVESSVASTLSLSEQKVKSVSRGVAEGVGVRVLHGERTGYSYSDDLSLSRLLEAADIAARIASGPSKSTVISLQSPRQTRRLETMVEVPSDIEEARKRDLLERADDAARTHDDRVKEVTCSYGDSRSRVVIVNSEGEWIEREDHLVRMSVNVLVYDGVRRETASEFLGGRYGFEYFRERTPEEAARSAAEKALQKLHARPAPTGELPVLIESGWGGVLVHEAVGHGLEGDFVRKGTSVYAGKTGMRVAAPGVTIVDDGTIPHARGSQAVDDEGVPMQRTVLIEDGILRGFLYDRLNARLMGTVSTGNGRRESFRTPPLPRMRNTFIAAGTENPRTLLRSVKRGVYARSLGGGQVDTVNGNFVFEVSEGLLIENGEVGYPLRGATLIGNGPEILQRIVGIGKNLEIEMGTGSCGKEGQYVPVGVGQPTILVSAMTVGGTAV